jgi:hypothetical protein
MHVSGKGNATAPGENPGLADTDALAKELGVSRRDILVRIRYHRKKHGLNITGRVNKYEYRPNGSMKGGGN